MTYKYYSPRQYEVLVLVDLFARQRDLERHRSSNMICVACGSVDLFTSRAFIPYRVTSRANGELRLTLSPFMQQMQKGGVKYDKFFTIMYDWGYSLSAECVRCGGPAVTRSEAEKRCRDRGCLGCMLCGKVSPWNVVEKAVMECSRCHSGDDWCYAERRHVDAIDQRCPASFMREYYAIKHEHEGRGLLPPPQDGHGPLARLS